MAVGGEFGTLSETRWPFGAASPRSASTPGSCGARVGVVDAIVPATSPEHAVDLAIGLAAAARDDTV